MGKNPAFQFYPSDWSRDLEEHPLEIEGAWIRICCKLWWEDVRGKATKTITQWSRILRVGEKKSFAIIAYLDKEKLADVVIQNETITISSRRMIRDEYIRKVRVLSGSQGGNPTLKTKSQNDVLVKQHLVNQKPTPSSSSSTSVKKESIKKESKLTLTDEQWLDAIKKNQAYKSISIETEKGKCEAWCFTNGKVFSRRRFVNWLNRAEKPMEGGNGNRQGHIRGQQAAYGNAGKARNDQGGLGIPGEYRPEPAPVISDEERKRNLAKVHDIMRGIETG